MIDAGQFTWEDAAHEYAALVTSCWGRGSKTIGSPGGREQGQGA